MSTIQISFSMSCSLGALVFSAVTLLYTSSMRLNYKLAVLVVISLISFHSHSYDLVDLVALFLFSFV